MKICPKSKMFTNMLDIFQLIYSYIYGDNWRIYVNANRNTELVNGTYFCIHCLELRSLHFLLWLVVTIIYNTIHTYYNMITVFVCCVRADRFYWTCSGADIIILARSNIIMFVNVRSPNTVSDDAFLVTCCKYWRI